MPPRRDPTNPSPATTLLCQHDMEFNLFSVGAKANTVTFWYHMRANSYSYGYGMGPLRVWGSQVERDGHKCNTTTLPTVSLRVVGMSWTDVNDPRVCQLPRGNCGQGCQSDPTRSHPPPPLLS